MTQVRQEEPPAEVTTEASPGPVTQHIRWRLGTKSYGIVFLVVVSLLLGLAIAAYQKRFTPVVTVTLETSRIGSQLQESSDVKLRGLIVGEVRHVEATPHGARIELALQPDEVGKIPSNVNARLLQKTLFGERYVDLVTVGAPSPRPIRQGDVITQDRSRVGIELETVFDNLYPLLRTVQPGKLAITLGALATALDGRGDQLGENLVRLDRYLSALNPHLPILEADIGLLADTLAIYADAAPDLFRLTESLRVTNRTVVDKEQQLAAFLVGTAGFANDTAGFLRDNEQRFIQVGRVSRPTLQVLARYAPVYPCLASGLVGWLPRINGAFIGGTFHITLEVVPPRQAYQPGEEPRWGDKRGPHCYGLPNPGGSQANPYPGQHFNDGTRPAGNASPLASLPMAVFRGAADSGTSGTVEEQQVVAALLSSDPGAQPSGIQTLLAGPIMRGAVVSNG